MSLGWCCQESTGGHYIERCVVTLVSSPSSGLSYVVKKGLTQKCLLYCIVYTPYRESAELLLLRCCHFKQVLRPPDSQPDDCTGVSLLVLLCTYAIVISFKVRQIEVKSAAQSTQVRVSHST